MATQDDVRRIALALPDTVEADDRFAFSVRNKGKDKGFVWVSRELAELIADAWRVMAPKALVKEFDQEPKG